MQLELLHNTTVLIECDLGDWIPEIKRSCFAPALVYKFKFYEHIKN